MSFDGVMLTVLAVLVGLVVGFARHGKVKAMGAAEVRARGLLVVGIGVPALADQFTRDVAVPLVIGAMAALFVFALANVRVAGMSVLAIGVLANLLPTLLNGGMPVRREALVEANIVERDELDRVDVNGARRLAEPTHQLRFLGDVIPLPETKQVLSFGDLIVLTGLADVTANLTRVRRRRRTGATADPAEDAVQVFEDLDELELPSVEDYLTTAVRSHVDAGEPFDPRPLPRPRPPETAPVDDRAAWGAGSVVTVLDDTADDTADPTAGADGLDEEATGTFDDLAVAGRWGAEVIWWTSDDPAPSPPEAAAEPTGGWAHELRAEPAWRTEPDDEPVTEPPSLHEAAGEPDALAPGHHRSLADEPAWRDDTEWAEPAWREELDADEDAEQELLAVDALDGVPGDGTIALDDVTADEPTAPEEARLSSVDEDVFDDRPFDDHAAVSANGHHDDLATLAHASPDELVKSLVGDLTVRRRNRRRTGGRHIPDFEPIHLDDRPG